MFSPMLSPRFAAVLAGLLALTMSGCSSLTDTQDRPGLRSDHLVVDQHGVVIFITQNAVASVGMDALFEGVIDTDDVGCLRLRLEGDERPTAIWPLGYTLSGNTAFSPVVHDANGVALGTVGGSFRVGGGIVAELSSSLGFTDADRELAAAQCPGSYWIVH